MFLIPILQLESELYSYGGRKWTVEKQLKETKIRLPIEKMGKIQIINLWKIILSHVRLVAIFNHCRFLR